MRAPRLTIAAGLVLLAAPLLTGAGGPTPPSLAARAARFPVLRSATAAFTQEREVSLVGEVLHARGTIALLAPAAMRLDLVEPEAMAILVNGTAVAVLDAQQVPLPVPAELSGIARFARELTELLFGVKAPDRFVEEWIGPETVTLVPRHAAIPFAAIVMRFAPDLPLPVAIELRERNGDRTTIHLAEVQLNPPLDDARFRLPAPTTTSTAAARTAGATPPPEEKDQ